MRALRYFGIALVWAVTACLTVWAAAALYVDPSPAGLGWAAAAIYLVVIAVLVAIVKRPIFRIGACVAAFLVVLAFWLCLNPSNDRVWQSNLSQTPWAEVSGDRVTIHNFSALLLSPRIRVHVRVAHQGSFPFSTPWH